MSYVYKAFIPVNVAAIYSYPSNANGALPWIYYLSPLVLAVIVILITKLKKHKRTVIFGISFFFIMIVITQITLLEDGYLANRYTYLPYIGLYVVLALLIDHLSQKKKTIRYSAFAAAAGMIVAFSIYTHQRSLIWKDSKTLFNHMIEKSPKSSFAYNLRGIYRYSKRDYKGALSDYSKAIEIYDGYAVSYRNRGLAFQVLGSYEKALQDFNQALKLDPNYSGCYLSRGILFMDIFKDNMRAIADYNIAIQIRPNFAQAYYNRGLAKIRQGNFKSACKDFKTVKKLGYNQADPILRDYCQ